MVSSQEGIVRFMYKIVDDNGIIAHGCACAYRVAFILESVFL